MNDIPKFGSDASGLADAELTYIAGGVTAAIRKVKPSLAATAFEAKTRFEDLGVSSIELITIVFEIEDFFEIVIVERNLDDLRTYGEACAIVAALYRAKPAAGAGQTT